RPVLNTWHGLPLQRVLIHLRYRALQLGVQLGWHELVSQSRCPMHLLAEALGDEPRRSRNFLFSDIVAGPIPRRFRKVWNRRHVMSADRRAA
ncbi:MAG TPA: hypothetical protein VGP99_07860, partial [Tepidisphaeraceae bacterium]|nr:hypothetical protein [Tepidisphaeraceae bacterium]